jgi:6-pyruvoyltetrahydropterin/6-carboxytetrahydropterin synthase
MNNSVATINIEYAHRFFDFEGEAQYLHGHSGILTVEIAGEVNSKTGFVHPCSGIKRCVWDYLKCFDHALILQHEDPLLSGILSVYEHQKIRHGSMHNRNLGRPFENELATAYPECRLVITNKAATCENLIEIFHALIKDSFNVSKMTFTSGENCASKTFDDVPAVH